MRLGSFILKWTPVQTDALSPVPGPREMGRLYEGGDGPVIECERGRPSSLTLAAEPITIGRLPSCDLVISDPAVSKQHCQVHWDGQQVRIQDLGSLNGTYLGDVRLKSHQQYPWYPEADLRIGPYAIRFVHADSTSA